MRRGWVVVGWKVLLLLTLGLLHGAAQSHAGAPVSPAAKPLPVYDVATIKPSKSDDHGPDVTTSAYSIVGRGILLTWFLQKAFGIQPDFIFGMPPWANNARFDIDAKIVDPDMQQLNSLTPEQRRAMLQALLADRFALRWHFEERTLPLYELVPAKNGSKLKAAPLADKEEQGIYTGNDRIRVTYTPMSSFCGNLSEKVHRAVVDKTGLKERYSFELKWHDDAAPGVMNDGKGFDQGEFPDLFTALQEQLGLKLQSGKGPVEVLVVDHATVPAEN